MATTKIWKVEKRLDHVINYTTNEEKTKNDYLENGVEDYDSIRQVIIFCYDYFLSSQHLLVLLHHLIF